MFPHTLDCKGPPDCCENRFYLYLFVISVVAAFLEFFIARKFAGSSSAQADAIHSFVHSFWYCTPIFIDGWVRWRNLSELREIRLRTRYGVVNGFILFAALAYIVLFEAIPKFYQAEPITANFMLLSVSVGITGNVIALRILQKTRRHSPHHHLHGLLHQQKVQIRKLFILDATGDLWISVVVFAEALLILTISSVSWALPYLPYIYRYIEPSLTLVIVAIIGRMSYKLFFKHS